MDSDRLSEAADSISIAAEREFGVDYLFPYQQLVVSNVLEGRDQLIVLPTGAGKSLCFLLPASLLPGLTVVVYPLRSLIADQARRLERGSINSEALTGETPKKERRALFERCRSGTTRLLLTNPEMMIQKSVRDALGDCEISHLVIDEAHVLPAWGKSFRPAYLEFARVAREIKPRIVSAFTATATKEIVAEISARLFPDGGPHIVRGVPDRPNIHYSVDRVYSIRHAVNVLARTASRPMLIFCRSRAGAELTARTLRSDTGDRNIRFYHAGLEPEEKSEIETWYFDSSSAILASTCAYGMGVDKSNIRTVIHVDVPESVESYLQETGRAGRDGDPSRAIALVPPDIRLIRRAPGIVASPEDSGRVPDNADTMLDYLKNNGRCRREFLLSALDTTIDGCTGCDVCDGTSRKKPDLQPVLRRFFRQNAHRYNHQNLASALAQRLGGRLGSDWNTPELEDLVDAIEESGLAGPPISRLIRALYGDGFVLRREKKVRKLAG